MEGEILTQCQIADGCYYLQICVTVEETYILSYTKPEILANKNCRSFNTYIVSYNNETSNLKISTF